MNTHALPPLSFAITVGLAAAVSATDALAQDPFSELNAYVEINATDGDIGFQVLVDGDAWHQLRIYDPSGKRIFTGTAKGSLKEQGLAENFFESDEPLCSPELVEEDEEVVTLEEFQQRFPAGRYVFGASTRGETSLYGTDDLTYSLPAAPDIEQMDGQENVDPANATVTWAPGSDLGVCPFGGLVPDPGTVPVTMWEVVVEPEDEEAVSPLRVFSAQLPGSLTSVTVPREFLEAYITQGVTVFKFEILAIEASGNRTASEGIFCTTDCPAEE